MCFIVCKTTSKLKRVILTTLFLLVQKTPTHARDENGSERPQAAVQSSGIRQKVVARAREAGQRWLWLIVGQAEFKIYL
jgi:hypothetical protein